MKSAWNVMKNEKSMMEVEVNEREMCRDGYVRCSIMYPHRREDR